MKKLLLSLSLAIGFGLGASADTYKLVTDASTLSDGDKILIVNVANKQAMSTTQNTNNRGTATVKITDNAIEPETDVQVITLEEASTANQWNFNVGTGYLCAASSGSNHLKTADLTSAGTNANATISIESNGNATIKFQGNYTRNWIRYNNSSKIFSCYSSGQQAVAVFKAESGVVDNRTEVTLKWEQDGSVVSELSTNLGETFAAPTLSITPSEAASEVVYSSSVPDVADFVNGSLEIKGAGKTTITAAISNSEKYKNASAEYVLTVVDPNATDVTYDFMNETYGMDRGNNTYVTEGTWVNGKVTIVMQKESGNGCRLWSDGLRVYKGTVKLYFSVEIGYVITEINFTGENGVINNLKYSGTSLNAGTWTGNADLVEIDAVPTSAAAIETIKVKFEKASDPSKADAGLKYDTTSYELTFGDAFTAPDLVNPNGLTVTYESSKPEVVEVDANTGAVTIKAPGVATITAKSEETDKFNAGSASYTLDIAAVASSIAQFETFGKNDSNLEIQVNFPMTVGFVNNQNVFVTDGEKWIQIYAPNSYNANDVIPAGWIGTYTLYRDYTPEIVPVGTLPVATETAELTFRNVSTISNADVNEVVVLENAVLSEASPAAKDDVPVTVNGEAVSVYNNYSVASVEAGIYNITGVVNIFQGSPVLYVIKFDAVPEAPVMKVDDVEMSDFTGMQPINEDALISFEAANGETIWYRLSKVEATVNALAENADGFTLYENPFKVGDNNTLEFYAESAAGVKSEIKTLKFSVITGIEGVEVDAVNGVVEYFNLQGVKVEAPANGLYIRRQGTKVEKVIVK